MELVIISLVIGVLFVIYQGQQQKKNVALIDSYLSGIPDFSVTKRLIGVDRATGLAIDEQRRKVCLIVQQQQKFSSRVFAYNDLLSSEIFEDGSSITKTVRSSQLGGALVGGIALGGVGAIIGGLSGKTNTTGKVSRVGLRLTVNDTQSPILTIDLLGLEAKKGDVLYEDAIRVARNWHGLIEVLIKRADIEDRENLASVSHPQPTFVADELKKLAELRDSGILSIEEFQQQKAKLLGSGDGVPVTVKNAQVIGADAESVA